MAPTSIPTTLHAHMAFAAGIPTHAHISVRQAFGLIAERVGDESDSDSDDEENFSAKDFELDPVHYYFMLLLILFIVAVLLFWFIYWRRTRSRKAGHRAGEQAPEMNVQGWTNTLHARFMPNNATLVRRSSNPAQYDEAPPPYQAKMDEAPPYPAVPLRTLSWDEHHHRSMPPQYTEYYGPRPATA
ncbi:hypothetical protein CFE70_000341 [Pyrenophora teres f. teres 0-1]|uniref:Uncharacterized protein n=2 Tax=Pyrenophora teres f. teres TaxID=97479 RepID=E3RJC5_PYRTT|nr:hypothetical protein PTT_08247 [Pyrenophora teres f. teres 0-1]KAE8836399.1 hypothetical protein HRS9139_04497 [Pyrenophora teres f. teres]KAE8837630.1 hypothetical protein PTNB85_04965 [Pyrenophora teres f. teres]KAE8839950.1 hypothetical protein HRS9122_06555 [Pyrenophora teres f. teres]KAE8862453.1 hypothetical protein PTNB29_05015 [Pyrenophora teres f. teres]